MSTVRAVYPNAVGLKYRDSDGEWANVELERKVFFPPVGSGWGFKNYICIW